LPGRGRAEMRAGDLGDRPQVAGALSNVHAGRTSSRPATRSGWRQARRSAIAAPMEMPPATKRSRPA
jgi:hypothetical protein